MRVICISGKAGSGKDTSGRLIKENLETRGARVIVTHYADLVKYICKSFFGWDGLKDEHGRHLLQHVGTDVVRKKYPDYWVEFLATIGELFGDNWDYMVIPDTRFPNEVDFLKDRFDVVFCRVIRDNFESKLTENQQNHESETALDDYFADFYLDNNGSIDDLRETVNTFIKEIVHEKED